MGYIADNAFKHLSPNDPSHNPLVLPEPLSLVQGGTGAATAADVRDALNVGAIQRTRRITELLKTKLMICVDYSIESSFALSLHPDELEAGTESEQIFNYYNLDMREWVSLIKKMGAGSAALTAMHVGGFTLWPSAVNAHGIQGTSYYASSKRDICREFVDECRRNNLKKGFYFSIQDKYNEPSTPAAYTARMQAHLTELLTQYGDLDFMLIDCSPWLIPYTTVSYDSFAALIHQYQPECLLIDNTHEHTLAHGDFDVWEFPAEGEPPAGQTIPTIMWDNFGGVVGYWFDHPDRTAVSNLNIQNLQERMGRALTSGYLTIQTLIPSPSGQIPADIVNAINQIRQADGPVLFRDAFILTSGHTVGQALVGNTSEQGFDWVSNFGPGSFLINPDGEAYINNLTGQQVYYGVSPSTPDYRVELDFKFATNTADWTLDVAARQKTDATEDYRLSMAAASGGHFNITMSKNVSSSLTTLGTYGTSGSTVISTDSKYTLSLSVRGSDIRGRLYIDGNLWTQFYASDSSVTAIGKPSMFMLGSGSATTGIHLLDFRVRREDYDSGDPALTGSPILAGYGTGTAYSLTNTSAAIAMGTTNPVLVLSRPGRYNIKARVNLKYNGATFVASRTVTIKLRRTNNTPGDLTNGTVTLATAIITTITATFMIVETQEVIYETTNSNDSITIFADVNTVPSAGSLDVVEASIVAEQRT
jgi:hypothetical protein